MAMIKILIVEDQTMLRESLEHVINEQHDMEVAGSTDDAANAPELCQKYTPDLVLMDIVTMNNSSGITYTAQIRKEFPSIKVVIMASPSEIAFAEEARKAGAQSFMEKDVGSDNLLYVIRYTMTGYSIYFYKSDRLAFFTRFTEKEIALICLVCQGMAQDEIAQHLGISESAIKKHITSILKKTGFDSISKFALYAMLCNT